MFADNRGDLVAKVASEDVKKVVAGLDDIDLTITGSTKDGGSFWGIDNIKVIECPSP